MLRCPTLRIQAGARSLSVYRFWRDLGYAIGALAGLIAYLLGMGWAIGLICALTFLSGLVVAVASRTDPEHGND